MTLISAPFIQSSFLILVQQTVYLIKSYLTKTVAHARTNWEDTTTLN